MSVSVVVLASLLLTLVSHTWTAPGLGGHAAIVGGEEAAPGEFPHQVSVLRGVGGSPMCGGSLISGDRVLTAGHCCDGQTPSRLAVRVGSFHLYEEDPGQADIAISSVILHPEYSAWTLDNDICVLQLAEQADLSHPNIGVIALPEEGEGPSPGTVCWVSGWGTTTEGGSFPSVLMKVAVVVSSYEDCFLAYDGVGVADSVMCAGDPEGGTGFCQGDSGGPLMCPASHGDHMELSGIASWSYGCAEPGYPGVYTQTSYFLPWIRDNM